MSQIDNEVISCENSCDQISSSETKYPLFYKWTLHYGPWNNIQNVLTVSDLADFWGLFNNIICPKELSFKKDYHFFRHGVAPNWDLH